MATDKKQRKLETALLASMFYPRFFMAIMDAVVKTGLTESGFMHADTRAAWMAVTALHKLRGDDWRKIGTADDVAIKIAVEETVNFHELDAARPELFSIQAVETLARQLVTSAEKHGFKQTLKTAVEMVDKCSDVQSAVILSRQAIGRWENTAVIRNGAVNIEDIADKLSEGHVEAHNTRKAGGRVVTKGLQLPWGVMNDCYNGLRNGLHVVAARPSEGKTCLAINISGFWRFNRIKHAFITLDMPIDEAVKRYGCYETELSDKHMATGYASEQEIAAYRESIKAYRDVVYLYESPELTAVEMAIREAVHNGAQAAIIDFLQLIFVTGVKSKWDSIQAATGTLKQLTRELKIPIIVLAQLNRQGVRDGREPELHDIEGGGFIEQAASTVLTMGRDKAVCEYWVAHTPTHLTGGNANLAPWLRPVWFNLLKNQTGPIGKFPFVMYCPFYVLRPGNVKGVACGGNNLQFFDTVNDDYRRLTFEKNMSEAERRDK